MESNTLELVKYIVGNFAELKYEVSYDVIEKDNVTEICVTLAESDMGKVIGKQGKIAKAMRTLVTASTPRGAKKTIVSIKEKDGTDAVVIDAADEGPEGDDTSAQA